MSRGIDYNSKEYKAERRKELVQECKQYRADCNYMIESLDINPDYAIMIEIKGIRIGLTDGFNEDIKTLILKQIEEANKCIQGKPNGYE